MMYLDLLLGFLKVGCFSFGGAYAAIPLIRDVVLSYGWIDEEMLTYMIAVSESTPGPIMVNLATYVGAVKAGIPGAAIATLSVVFPAFIVTVLITSLLARATENRYVQALLGAVKPCIIGIILFTGLRMTVKSMLADHSGLSLDFTAAAITAGLAIVYFGARKLRKGGISPILLILLAAVTGIAVYGI